MSVKLVKYRVVLLGHPVLLCPQCDPWKISVLPKEHAVSTRGVDVLIGAEGKHVTVPGFR